MGRNALMPPSQGRQFLKNWGGKEYVVEYKGRKTNIDEWLEDGWTVKAVQTNYKQGLFVTFKVIYKGY